MIDYMFDMLVNHYENEFIFRNYKIYLSTFNDKHRLYITNYNNFEELLVVKSKDLIYKTKNKIIEEFLFSNNNYEENINENKIKPSDEELDELTQRGVIILNELQTISENMKIFRKRFEQILYLSLQRDHN